ncbi:uncharacterized protein HMPREF1541_07812 [Cyphellophora europaea CBS 101466]|uniref:Zn(2)-C6 fungal-type domain-containing protein n=1 Tax=Cyphellophora europaea (strain CBS 101466) TaxID=1220924 RepID=W2RKG7_CYPE1|nr:uncharacterized protein HMPREF1541_07812 [Cyphellophora europaea CBS 101466]ETN36825.1 hypothetical protein HMPREF1541_07812 [Cyphellophora europaea CBS 101466]
MPFGTEGKPSACQRCYRKKIRCDKTQPACSHCYRVDTPCVYVTSGRELRRQNVDRLEDRIRDLESKNRSLTSQLYEVQKSPEVPTPTTSASQTGIQQGQSDVANQVIHLSLSASGGTEFVGSTSGLFLANLLQPHIQQSSALAQGIPTVLQDRQQTTSPPSKQARPSRNQALQILEAYCSHDHVCYPFLCIETLREALDRVYAVDTTQVGLNDCFFIDAVLALGSAQVYKLGWTGIWDAETHFSRATSQLSNVLDQGGLVSLQALLLICQYRMGTTSQDTTASVWHLIGVAARTCFELGLHKASSYTPNEACGESQRKEVDIKRRCLWSVVAMDRVVSLMLGRPLAIQLEDIELELPQVGASSSESCIFAHVVRYRIICGKILNGLHRSWRGRKKAEDYAELRQQLEHELNYWRSETSTLVLVRDDSLLTPAAKSTFRAPEWYDLLYHNGILMLFRPSPCLSDATTNSVTLQHVYESSQKAINYYASLHRSRKINYSWITLHAVFIAGLSYIYALRNHFQHIRRSSRSLGKSTLNFSPTITQVVNDTRACSKILVAVSERWTMARSCSEVFDKLSDAVVEDVVEAQTAQAAALPNTASTRTIDMVLAPTPSISGSCYDSASPDLVNMTVDSTLRDCFGDLRTMCYDQYCNDAIAQLSQDWMFGIGESSNELF